MHNAVTITIPEPWLKGLDLDQETMVQDIFMLGVRQYRVQRALDLYRAGAGSLGYAAQQAGVPKQDIIREARAQGLDPAFDEETVQEELGR